jgi:hypothetical protein
MYWNAQRDSEAFAAFVEAAKRYYRPAQKYIGDAYLEGRGLPSGESQNSDTAVEWYKRSCGKLCDPNAIGFPDAQRALADLSEYLKKNRFDAAVFQNPDFITAIYNSKYDGVPVGPLFVYLNGFVEEIGGDKFSMSTATASRCRRLQRNGSRNSAPWPRSWLSASRWSITGEIPKAS